MTYKSHKVLEFIFLQFTVKIKVIQGNINKRGSERVIQHNLVKIKHNMWQQMKPLENSQNQFEQKIVSLKDGQQ